MGLLGVYANQTDLYPWTPLETLKKCHSPIRSEDRGLWNAMLYPLLNSTVQGGIFYEGQVGGQEQVRAGAHTQVDVEEGTSLQNHSCLINGTLTTWIETQAGVWNLSMTFPRT